MCGGIYVHICLYIAAISSSCNWQAVISYYTNNTSIHICYTSIDCTTRLLIMLRIRRVFHSVCTFAYSIAAPPYIYCTTTLQSMCLFIFKEHFKCRMICSLYVDLTVVCLFASIIGLNVHLFGEIGLFLRKIKIYFFTYLRLFFMEFHSMGKASLSLYSKLS